MFLEWWMIAVLGVMFVIALIQTHRDAGIDGYRNGINHGAEMALAILESRGIIEIRDGGEIVGLNKKI